MPANAAMALIAIFCLMLGFIALLLARVILTRPAVPTKGKQAQGSTSQHSDNIALQLGTVLAQEAAERIQSHPMQSVLLAALLGTAVGAAPKETSALLKTLSQSLDK